MASRGDEHRGEQQVLTTFVRDLVRRQLRQAGVATESDLNAGLNFVAGINNGGSIGVPSDEDPLAVGFVADPGTDDWLSRADHVHPLAMGAGTTNQLLGMNAAADALEYKAALYDEATGLLTLPVTGAAAGITLGAAARVYETASGVLGLSPISIGGSGSVTPGASVGRTNTDAAVYGLSLSTTLIQTATAAIESSTAILSSFYRIGLGFSNSDGGAANTLELDNLRASQAAGGDSGTIGYQRALANYWGHSDDDLYASPLTTDSDGMLSYPKCKRGVITTLRHLHISDVESIAVPSTWAGGTPYVAGNLVKPTVPAGYWYICQTGGTSGGGEPAWNTTAEGSTNDNGVIWRTLIIPAVTTQHGISIDALAFGGTNRAIYFAGSGAANGPTWAGGANLYESAAGILKTDGNLRAAGALGVGSSTPTVAGRIQCSEDLYAVGGHFSGPMDAGSGNLIGDVNQLYFDGNNDYLLLGTGMTPELDSATNFSFCFWCKWDDITKAADYMFSKSASGTNRILIDSVASQLRFYVNNGATAHADFTLTGAVGNNEWHHFAFVYAGAQATNELRVLFYFDGVLTALTGFTGTIDTSSGNMSAANTSLSNTGTNAHQGYLADFRIYSASISAASVLLAMQGSTAPANMVHRWKLNEGTGSTTCTDTGSNPETATITNAAWQNVAYAGVGMPLPFAALALPVGTIRDQGIGFGHDTWLYRSAQGYLKTPGTLVANYYKWAGQGRVTSQFDKTNATLANVTGLTANVAAGLSYTFQAVLFVDASAVGGTKYAVAGTCTATSIIYEVVLLDNATLVNTIASRQTALAGAVGQAGTTAGMCVISGQIVVATAGTLVVQFAQNAANGTSSVLAGSHLMVNEIG